MSCRANRNIDLSFVFHKAPFLSTWAMVAFAAIAFFSWSADGLDARARGQDQYGAGAAQIAPVTAIKARPDRKNSKIDMSQARVVVNGGGVKFTPPEPGSYKLAKINTGVDGAVIDVLGRKQNLLDVIGDKIGLISFIYTQCGDEDGCPMAVSTFYQVEDLITKDADLKANVKMVTLSFDPTNDTPDVMADFANVHASDSVDHSLHLHNLEAKYGLEEAKEMAAFLGDAAICNAATVKPDGGWNVQTGTVDQTWAFLTTASESDLNPILDGYSQYIIKDIDENGQLAGTFSHVLKVYLVDRNHDVRNIYSTSFLYPKLVVNDLKTLLLEERFQVRNEPQ